MLEVIAVNVNDAINAEKGGANRLEIVSSPDEDGLTPTLETVKQIVNSISIPARVMIRDRNVFNGFSSSELKNMALTVKKLSEINVDGVVVGFLNENNSINFDALRIVLEYKGNMKVTFHRAFDKVNNFENSLEELINSGMFDKILTSGIAAKAEDGITVLNKMNSLSKGKISIIAGGSVSNKNIKKIKVSTGITEFHVGKAVRKNQSFAGDILPEKVKELADLIS